MALSHGADGDLAAVWAPTAGAVGGPAAGGPKAVTRRLTVLLDGIVYVVVYTFPRSSIHVSA